MDKLMRSPGPQFAMCVVLAALAILLTLIGSTIVQGVALPLTILLLGAEIDRSGGLFAVRLVRAASALLPRAERDAADEWEDHVRAVGESGLLPLFTALSIALWAAPRMAVASRWRVGLVFLLGSYLLAWEALTMKETEEPRVLRGFPWWLRFASLESEATDRKDVRLIPRLLILVTSPFRAWAIVATPLLWPYALVRWRKRPHPTYFSMKVRTAIGCGMAMLLGFVLLPRSQSFNPFSTLDFSLVGSALLLAICGFSQLASSILLRLLRWS